jgi:hypothetical protein
LEWWVWWKCLLVPGAAAKYSASTHATDPALWCEEILFQAAIINFFFSRKQSTGNQNKAKEMHSTETHTN